ncbi:MAG: TonB-dependent receptor, partial [Calditrichaeota bacterium]
MMRQLTGILILIIFLASTQVWAGNTGKISGRVTDKETGEPLIGVNVLVKETNLGSATDEDGFYFILQVPPGTYDLEFSYIGYHTLTVTGVRVRVDLTQTINVEMESQAVQGPQIEVVAEQLLVQKDITATRRTASREEIEDTPGFQSTTDIFLLQGGAFVDAAGAQTIALGEGNQLQVRDESLKDIHIRGGRGGEILYMVDGVPVTHPIYGGRDVLNLNVVDVQEMELLTGAFNAEYGQAQSGVVNITTRSGSERYEGGLEYKTGAADYITDNYGFNYTSFYIGGPEPITRKLVPQTGLELPGRMTFFISGNATLSNTPYNNNRDRDQISALGLDFNSKQDNVGNLNAKVNWEISNKLSMNLSYHGSSNKWSRFDWLWQNYPNHLAEYTRNNNNLNFNVKHTLSKSTFYHLNFGYLGVDYDASLNDQSPPEYWTFYKDGNVYDYWTYERNFSDAPDSVYSRIKAPVTDRYGLIDRQSYESIWRDDVTATWSFKGDITSQIHHEHLMKTGLELRYNDIQYVDIQDGGYSLSKYGDHVFNNEVEFPKPVGPYPEFGENRWVFDAFPVQGGAYIQDKFEKEALIINAGIRFDWLLLGKTIMGENWRDQWEKATGETSDWSEFKYKVSPRFGISFPITQRTVLFFSYGHFNQLPEMQYFYRDPYTGGFTGNPHLDFEQTILYEFGFTHQLAQNWAIDIKSYAKDISKQVQTTQLRAALGLPVYLYDNKGYARARGLEFELTKRYSNFISGKMNYTVQWANGYSSSAFDDYVRSLNDFPNPIRERPLDWDIRHQIIFQMSVAAPENRGPNIFGLQLPDNWNISVLSRFSSGQ